MMTKEQLKEERDKIVKGLEETYRKLVEYKRQKNRMFFTSEKTARTAHPWDVCRAYVGRMWPDMGLVGIDPGLT